MKTTRMICTALLVSITLGCQSANFKMPSLPKMPSLADLAENRPRLFAKKDKGDLPPPSRHFDTIKNDAQIARNESLEINTGKPVPPSQASQPYGPTSKEVASQGDRFQTPDVAGYSESKESNGPGIRQPYQYDGDKQNGVKDAAKALAENWKGLDRIDNMPNSLPVSSGEFSSEFAAASRKPAELPSEFALPKIPAPTSRSGDFELPTTSTPRSLAMNQGGSNSFAPVLPLKSGPASVEGLTPASTSSSMNPSPSIAATENQYGTSGSLAPLEGTNRLTPMIGSSSQPFANTNRGETPSGPAAGAIEYPRTAQADNTFDRVLPQANTAQNQPMTPSSNDAFESPNRSGFSVAASGSPPTGQVDLRPVTKNQNYMIHNPFANEAPPDRQGLATQSPSSDASPPAAIRSVRLPDSLRTSRGYAPGSTGRRTAF